MRDRSRIDTHTYTHIHTHTHTLPIKPHIPYTSLHTSGTHTYHTAQWHTHTPPHTTIRNTHAHTHTHTRTHTHPHTHTHTHTHAVNGSRRSTYGSQVEHGTNTQESNTTSGQSVLLGKVLIQRGKISHPELNINCSSALNCEPWLALAIRKLVVTNFSEHIFFWGGGARQVPDPENECLFRFSI